MGHVVSRLLHRGHGHGDSKTVVIRDRRLTIVKDLAEGGFSTVYLVRDQG